MPKMASKVSLASSISPQVAIQDATKLVGEGGTAKMVRFRSGKNKCFVNCEDVLFEECLLNLSKEFCRKFPAPW